MVLSITSWCFNHCYCCAHTDSELQCARPDGVFEIVNLPSHKQAERKAEFVPALLENYAVSALWILTGTSGSLFPRAVWKSHFQVPHQSVGDANGCILLFSGPCAFGWCILGRLGLQAAWSITNKHDAAQWDTKVHLQTEGSTCFFSSWCAFSLTVTLIASSLIIASPEQDWTVLVFSFVPDQLTYLGLFDFLPLLP